MHSRLLMMFIAAAFAAQKCQAAIDMVYLQDVFTTGYRDLQDVAPVVLEAFVNLSGEYPGSLIGFGWLQTEREPTTSIDNLLCTDVRSAAEAVRTSSKYPSLPTLSEASTPLAELSDNWPKGDGVSSSLRTRVVCLLTNARPTDVLSSPLRSIVEQDLRILFMVSNFVSEWAAFAGSTPTLMLRTRVLDMRKMKVADAVVDAVKMLTSGSSNDSENVALRPAGSDAISPDSALAAYVQVTPNVSSDEPDVTLGASFGCKPSSSASIGPCGPAILVHLVDKPAAVRLQIQNA